MPINNPLDRIRGISAMVDKAMAETVRTIQQAVTPKLRIHTRGNDNFISPLHLRGSDLRGGRLPSNFAAYKGLDFTGADMSAALLERCTFDRCKFDGAIMCRANMKYAKFDRCTFHGTQMEGVIANGAQFTGCGFWDADLQYAQIPDTWFYMSPFWRCTLRNAGLAQAVFRECYFDEVDLRDAYLRNADFTGSCVKSTVKLDTVIPEITDLHAKLAGLCLLLDDPPDLSGAAVVRMPELLDEMFLDALCDKYGAPTLMQLVYMRSCPTHLVDIYRLTPRDVAHRAAQDLARVRPNPEGTTP